MITKGSPSTYQQLKKGPIRNQDISRQGENVYLSRPEPKEWINRVKANNINVHSTVPVIKYYGDNTYAEYQMVNPHQQS